MPAVVYGGKQTRVGVMVISSPRVDEEDPVRMKF
jgi:hypothetical protein